MRRLKPQARVGLLCLALVFLVLLHQRLTCGEWFQVEQVLHHETIALILLSFGVGLLAERVKTVVDHFQSLLWFLLSCIAVHEGFHYSAMALFGAKGAIHLDVHWLIWLGGYVEWIKYVPPGTPLWAVMFIYWAGGGLTGLLLLWAYFFESDIEDQLWELVFAGFQLGYATCGEMWMPIYPASWIIGAAVGGFLGALFGTLIWLKKRW